jgi:hypothetical protein
MCGRVTRRRMMKGKEKDYIGNMISRVSQLKVVDDSW